ncbi:DUF92 domain-containing protein [Ilyomonas limi]|uniref:DUF92 domain-containing protein n=1 Tax=Ilyomonas limi TaxID=2575867 RepID=A0A4V5UU86_9BACT|nr:DUF92 domain-containing protein [Ilyomonas limi]TKK68063.1 DUF92 domain-containing protein [Ilyomonas limi]
MVLQYVWLFVILAGAMITSVAAKKLTVAAALTGGILGLSIYAGAGFTGIALIAVFFMLGTLATSWKKKYKEDAGLSEIDSSRRNAGQVMANAGVAAICGVFGHFFKEYVFIFRLMMSASLSSAMADTLSSELGNVYGKRFYNILTLQKDMRGLNGVVSLEGTVIGIVGSAVIALVYAVGFGFAPNTFLTIIIAGTIGNLCDSVLGASLERKQYLNNDAVNFLNTAIAALVAFSLYFLF